MKALSGWQPWVSLCVPLAPGEKPVKTIETRSWSTNYRGRLILHAAKTMEGIELVDVGRMCREDDAAIVEALTTRGGVEKWADLPLGAIVGSCTLAGVVPIAEFTWSQFGADGWTCAGNGDLFVDRGQLPYGDFSPGRYAWLLEDAKRTDERCPACWGSGIQADWEGSAVDCAKCDGKGSCDPIRAKGKQGLWEWTP